jgi:hypothetical protein
VPRIVRNYLISFAIIGLIVLAVHLVNRWAEEQLPAEQPAATEDSGSADSGSAGGGSAGSGSAGGYE